MPGGSPQRSAPSEMRCAGPPAAPGSQRAAAPRRSAAFRSDFGASHRVRRRRCLCAALTPRRRPSSTRRRPCGESLLSARSHARPTHPPPTSRFLPARRTHARSHADFPKPARPLLLCFFPPPLSRGRTGGWAHLPPLLRPTPLELGAPLRSLRPPHWAARRQRDAAGGCAAGRAGKLEREPRWREGRAAPELRGAARKLRGAAVRRFGGVRESDGAPCPSPGASRGFT